MAANEAMFDNLFCTVMEKASGIDGFFDNIYSFLRRRTDFFVNKGF